MPLKKILLEIALLSAAALIVAFAVNRFSPRRIPLLGQWSTAKGVVDAGGKTSKVSLGRDLELPEAKTLFEQGVPFLDARSEDYFRAGHIKGAEWLPVEDFYARIVAFKKAHPDFNQLMVAYCSGRECTDSHELAENLLDAGFVNVKVFIDGFPLWESEKLPVEK